MPAKTRTAAQILVDVLAVNGVSRVFAVPGESYLAVLDALHDSAIKTIVCRQEGGAAMMAEATGKLTGRPGICFVTRAPGATNAASGLHVAEHDATPMILFIGQIARGMRHRGAFQEADYSKVFGSIAKWVVEVDEASRMDELVSRAFQVAMNGRPGPVVVALPEDVLTEVVDNAPAPVRREAVETCPGLTYAVQLQKKLWAAERPMVILGGSRWSEKAVRSFTRFAEAFDVPVAVSFRRQMLFDHLHPNYAGDVGIGINPALKARIQDSDLLILVGSRLSEMPSQDYSLVAIPQPGIPVVHVYPDAEELGRVYHADLAIHATPEAFAAVAEGLQPPNHIKWHESTRAAHAAYLDWSTPKMTTPGTVQLGEIMSWLNARLPATAVMTNGAGNYATWGHRFLRHRSYGSQLSPTSGSMGYGLPAAIAAKLEKPDAPVICFAGDGCFQMTSQEFGTAAQWGAGIVVIVIDNGIYGTIRMHQEREYPGRISGTMMVNPDFAALARAYGAHAETVVTTEQFFPAFDRALADSTSRKMPSLIHVKIDPDAISPATTLSKIRAAAQDRQENPA